MTQVAQRALKGQTSYHAGAASEEAVARDYERRGYGLLQERWRGQGGEIDLILQNGDGFVFVEVKHARHFAGAALRIGPRQIQRIYASAEEFLGTQPLGALSEARFDVALVDGQGDIQIIENAFGEI
ncbi:hypothetical protein ROLI_036170 [Roseobacter fucihabitans]|uniref:UPF0102 protein ROLI_036170 n=1 Tax=Roseobacter fucihabitans TaxID=1537242 RepID=A0ABZ2BWU5_9RHOB|nr:YraN family protein [Roseobacter litoralis]MBC6964521.1 hypothetical protein [Roseobacter litoralis]